jgi:hypothetical protein
MEVLAARDLQENQLKSMLVGNRCTHQHPNHISLHVLSLPLSLSLSLLNKCR